MKLAMVFSLLLTLSSTALSQTPEKVADTILHRLGTFLTSREFAVNFLANLLGAMAGVLLAFLIQHVRTRREARMLFGRILQTSRSELAYLKPMCETSRNAWRSGGASTLDSLGVPATRNLLISPVVHDQAPHSLIMALTILCRSLDVTESAFQDARQLQLPPQAMVEGKLAVAFGDKLDQASKMMTIVLEQIDLQLERLRLKKTPDAGTQEVSRRLREILHSPEMPMTGQSFQTTRETPKSAS